MSVNIMNMVKSNTSVTMTCTIDFETISSQFCQLVLVGHIIMCRPMGHSDPSIILQLNQVNNSPISSFIKPFLLTGLKEGGLEGLSSIILKCFTNVPPIFLCLSTLA